MEFNWSILAWVAGLVFVYIFGLYEGRGQGYKRRKAEEAAEKKAEPAPAPASTPVEVKVEDPGLLRIKNEDGYLTLDLDGERVNTMALTTDQRKRLIEMLTLMRPWLEGKPVAAPAAPVPPPPVATAPPAQPQPVADTRPGTPATPIPPVPQPASQPIASRPATIAKEDRPAAPAGSIVNQIDAILQARLVGTPLEARGVFLAQSPEGGVMVYVGLTKYMGIEDVPDPEIKAAIRAAISEWENKYTPGL